MTRISPFTIVSFYTTGTQYEAHAAKLIHSLQGKGLDYEVIPVDRTLFNSWELACAYKSRFCRDRLESLNRPIVWVDADATIERDPALFFDFVTREVDFAAHFPDRKGRSPQVQHVDRLLSGTLYFGNTFMGTLLVNRWVDECERYPDTWDQVCLADAIAIVRSCDKINVQRLPESYTHIFDQRGIEPPVITHHQASRKETKKKVVVNAKPTDPAR